MGHAIRKYQSFCQRLLTSLRPVLADVAKTMPADFSDDDFVMAFKTLCSAKWIELAKTHEYYTQRDRTRDGRKFRFPDARTYVLAHSSTARQKERHLHADGTVPTQEIRKERERELAQLNERQLARRALKEEQRRETQQDVQPPYLLDLAKRYRRSDKNTRLQIVKEMAKYNNPFSRRFLYQVLAGESDYFIVKEVFLALQKAGQVVFLPKKHKGKPGRSKLGAKYGEYKPDLGRTATDIMKDMNMDTVENLKHYDLFLSHSSKDKELIVALAHELNDLGLTVYVDWIADREDMARAKANADVPRVLIERMNASDFLLLVLTDSAAVSGWVAWEIGYFMSTHKGLCVLDLAGAILKRPEFIQMHPSVTRKDASLIVTEAGGEQSLQDWLTAKRPGKGT